MQIETYIDSLVSYAMNRGLAEPVDHQVLVNRILDILHKEDYAPSDEPQSEDLEEILKGILDYACEKGLCEDNVTARDIFATRIMGAVTPMPREIIRTFREKYAVSPQEATDWYYRLSCDTDYIRRYRIAKDMRWKYASEYGIRYHGLEEGQDASFFLAIELIPGYLEDITGEYATPKSYFVDEKEAEEFDQLFHNKEKKKYQDSYYKNIDILPV